MGKGNMVLIALLFVWGLQQIAAQEWWSPYPIIYIHGLDSEDKAWHETISKLSSIHGTFLPNGTTNTGNVFNAMLNRYEEMTAMFGPDGIVGTTDDDVYTQRTALQPGSVFAVNFNNSWNNLPTAPTITFYQDYWALGSRESQSNEAAIIKQGYALKKCIEAVLKATRARKVILVGHSMGGLCIREYLQRRVGGVPRWWIDPNQADGHKVAKVVTYGTPHHGSNASEFVPIVRGDSGRSADNAQFGMIPFLPNTSSDAVRDLRYSYVTGTQKDGVYLYGGNESGLNTNVVFGWHNADVDCNGYENDIVEGISWELNGTMPLPMNISYTWITSNSGVAGAGDKVVDLERQSIMTADGRGYPVGLSDTLLTSRYHWNQTDDAASIARGLDEPRFVTLAYDIDSGRIYRGGISMQSGGTLEDYDTYRLLVPESDSQKRSLKIRIRDLSPTPRELYCAIVDFADKGVVMSDFADYHQSGTILTVSHEELSRRKGTVYLIVVGNATSAAIQSPYEMTYWYETPKNLPPELAVINDTSMKYGATLILPLNLKDESIQDLTFKLYSSDKRVVRDGDIIVKGTGTPRTLVISPTGTIRGVTTITVEVNDGEYSAKQQFRLNVDDATDVAENSVFRNQAIQLSVHPSVASTHVGIVLDVPAQLQTRVELIAHTGVTVAQLYNGVTLGEANLITLPLANLPSGLYWVRAVCGTVVIQTPLVIAR